MRSDALEEIFEVLSEACKEVYIETDDFKFSSASELVNKYKLAPPSSLKISSSNPYCYVELNSLWAELYIGSSTNEESGIFYKINEILLRSQRRPKIAYSYYFVYLVPNCISFAFYFLAKDAFSVTSLIAIHSPVFAWSIWIIYIRLKKHTKIVLESSINKKNFFTRHADQIILGTIVAIITTIVNFAGDGLVKKFFPTDDKSKAEETGKIK